MATWIVVLPSSSDLVFVTRLALAEDSTHKDELHSEDHARLTISHYVDIIQPDRARY